ncbi:hypothetical protein ACRALDRAFT_1040590 [Sodiomyces alcalophilus JCM 7366]|uniref:uncharacterized protein n=1 Tax=Sodiomyces alcalophilus JCM 7366 TaxID=591952 RepID=UPI0039B3A0B3
MSASPPGVGRPGSIQSNESNDKQPEKKKSRRPANTAFRQQRLKAWQPILTPKTVLPLFFTIGIIFAPIGGLLLYASSEVKEIRIDYTGCKNDAPLGNDLVDMSSDRISTAFKSDSGAGSARWRRIENVPTKPRWGLEYDATVCEIEFTIPEDMGPPVLFYYHLTNFYQNHRRYVSSFFPKQLKGDAESASAVNGSECDPLKWDEEHQKPIYPCGLIANSLFNDTFTSPLMHNVQGSSDNSTVYEMQNNTDIAWASDADLYGPTKYKPSDVMPPPNWHVTFPNYTTENPPPNLGDWQAFQVWMRTAGLPEFSKLYQRNNDEPMRAGTYTVNVTDNFPTLEYKGTKSIVISTRTVMGGRNNFLGISYIVVGGLCIVLGAIFTVTHLLKPRKLGDHTYLSWNNAPGAKQGQAGGQNTAFASGRELRPSEA